MPEFSKITNDTVYITILNERWKEAIICANDGANMAASTMLGSILEGVLYKTAVDNPQGARASKSAPPNKDIEKWSLNDLINIAIDCKWIKRDRRAIAEIVRDYRNLIHPREQLKTGKSPDKYDVKMSVVVVRAAIDDLIENNEIKRRLN